MTAGTLTPETAAFYLDAIRALGARGVEFLVGGSYALEHYTGLEPHTKDADLFLRQRDVPAALDALSAAGYRSSLTFPHWLAKAALGDDVIDLIFSSGNGIARVDEDWFANAAEARMLDVPVRVIPVEEMIWSKAFIQERERYDGADIAHLLRAHADSLDWPRLLERFGEHHRVLLAHLVLFGYAYPGERTRIPTVVMRELLARTEPELDSASDGRICRGTLLSRAQYRCDLDLWGYLDPRTQPPISMTQEELARWNADIKLSNGE